MERESIRIVVHCTADRSQIVKEGAGHVCLKCSAFRGGVLIFPNDGLRGRAAAFHVDGWNKITAAR